MNKAFKELERTLQKYFGSDKTQTKVYISMHPKYLVLLLTIVFQKLFILHQAVSTITSLEQQLQEQNIKPKACLREPEEGEDRSTDQNPPLKSSNVVSDK